MSVTPSSSTLTPNSTQCFSTVIQCKLVLFSHEVSHCLTLHVKAFAHQSVFFECIFWIRQAKKNKKVSHRNLACWVIKELWNYPDPFQVHFRMSVVRFDTLRAVPEPQVDWRKSESAYEHDWHNMRSYLFLNVQQFLMKQTDPLCKGLYSKLSCCKLLALLAVSSSSQTHCRSLLLTASYIYYCWFQYGFAVPFLCNQRNIFTRSCKKAVCVWGDRWTGSTDQFRILSFAGLKLSIQSVTVTIVTAREDAVCSECSEQCFMFVSSPAVCYGILAPHRERVFCLHMVCSSDQPLQRPVYSNMFPSTQPAHTCMKQL